MSKEAGSVGVEDRVRDERLCNDPTQLRSQLDPLVQRTLRNRSLSYSEMICHSEYFYYGL